MIDQFFTDTDDLASELATDIANAFRYKAKQLGADVSIDSLCDFHGYVQGTIADRLRGAGSSMTHDQAIELVEELIQAHHDYEFYGDNYYRQEYLATKKKVIAVLTTVSRPPNGDAT